MKKIGYMPLNGGIMGQATGPQPVFLISSKLGNWQLDWSQFIATGNCSPVAISCSPVQLPVFVPVANWTSKHYCKVAFHHSLSLTIVFTASETSFEAFRKWEPFSLNTHCRIPIRPFDNGKHLHFDLVHSIEHVFEVGILSIDASQWEASSAMKRFMCRWWAEWQRCCFLISQSILVGFGIGCGGWQLTLLLSTVNHGSPHAQES